MCAEGGEEKSLLIAAICILRFPFAYTSPFLVVHTFGSRKRQIVGTSMCRRPSFRAELLSLQVSRVLQRDSQTLLYISQCKNVGWANAKGGDELSMWRLGVL
jgi:hypothetical protein